MRCFERQAGERQDTYLKFCMYRDMGPARSLRKLAQELGCSEGNLQQLSSKHDWQARVQAYDDHLQMTRQNAIEHYEREKMRDLGERRNRVQEEVVGLQERALVRLKEMMEHGVIREQIVEEKYEDGRPKTIKNI